MSTLDTMRIDALLGLAKRGQRWFLNKACATGSISFVVSRVARTKGGIDLQHWPSAITILFGSVSLDGPSSVRSFLERTCYPYRSARTK